MVTCPWCNTHYQQFKSTCDNCGGPLPPPPGDDPGDAPPPPPRQLPATFARRMFFIENIYFSLPGMILAGVGLILAITFLSIGIAMPPFLLAGGIAFGAVTLPGLILIGVAWSRSKRQLSAFRDGIVASGQIARIYQDVTVRVNRRHPWAVVYTFDVGGQSYEGKARTWDSSVQQRQPGQPLHVLYGPDDPRQNTIYPPFK